jgi:hypothetical protein
MDLEEERLTGVGVLVVTPIVVTVAETRDE